MGDSNKVHISFIITNVSTNNPFTGYRTHFNSEKGLFPSHCIEITIDNMKRGRTPPFQCWSPSCALACPHFDAGLPPVPSCTSILMPVGGDLPPAPLHLSISTPDSLMRQGGHHHLLEQLPRYPNLSKPVPISTKNPYLCSWVRVSVGMGMDLPGKYLSNLQLGSTISEVCSRRNSILVDVSSSAPQPPPSTKETWCLLTGLTKQSNECMEI